MEINKKVKLDFKLHINKELFFKKLNIKSGTETYKNADSYFYELKMLINNIKLTAVYVIVEFFDVGIVELENCTKYVICFISFDDEINNLVSKLMLSGDYLKGYLLNEMAVELIFNASIELNKKVKEDILNSGYKLTKRYSPGDGSFELKFQEKVLNTLKENVAVNAYLTDCYMIVPEKSLLYLYGLGKDSCMKNNNNIGIQEEYYESSECNTCSNKNCLYRDIR